MMDDREMHEHMVDLIQLDTDAVHAYQEAIERIEDMETRQRLTGFMQDHERHITELNGVMAGMGHDTVTPKADIKGKLLEGMTAMRSAMGDGQALKAMHQNETVTNKAYEKAIAWDVPTNVREVLARNYADEQRHIAWIDQQVEMLAGAGTRGGY